ncbi:hypothetical protein BDA99DRAFT_579290 [Phascolomyces articulosus]|uniref:Uncharacterized protein n=1 Tax=Phascolomyces articulosus TaxID=60185 RepID=A0AAD5KCI3_9FUNG|nr:hypothetical protein BDA99DRAFT_579290 [Phascolomyces articulosus]
MTVTAIVVRNNDGRYIVIKKHLENRKVAHHPNEFMFIAIVIYVIKAYHENEKKKPAQLSRQQQGRNDASFSFAVNNFRNQNNTSSTRTQQQEQNTIPQPTSNQEPTSIVTAVESHTAIEMDLPPPSYGSEVIGPPPPVYRDLRENNNRR